MARGIRSATTFNLERFRGNRGRNRSRLNDLALLFTKLRKERKAAVARSEFNLELARPEFNLERAVAEPK